MTHIFWEPFQQLQAIRNEMERVFEQYTPSSRAYARSAFLPSLGARRYPLVNIREDQDKIYVEALAPGLNPGSIEAPYCVISCDSPVRKPPLTRM